MQIDTDMSDLPSPGNARMARVSGEWCINITDLAMGFELMAGRVDPDLSAPEILAAYSEFFFKIGARRK